MKFDIELSDEARKSYDRFRSALIMAGYSAEASAKIVERFYSALYKADSSKATSFKMSCAEEAAAMLNGLLTWSQTPQGRSYWSTIHSKLEELE